jgi:uncharacterized glyoxalase superfamily protein PhnB
MKREPNPSGKEMNTPHFRSVSPILPVENVDAAIAFYTSVLGFALGWKWGDPPSVASVCRDEVELMLELAPKAAGAVSAKCYIVMADLDHYHGEIVAAGAQLIHPLALRDYGMKDCRIMDPFGNELSFGEPLG